MSVPTDPNFLDLFFEGSDHVLNFIDDKEIFRENPSEKSDLPIKLENWPNDDFLNEILDTGFDLDKPLDDVEITDSPFDDTSVKTENGEFMGSSDCSDSGYSNGQLSPGRSRHNDFLLSPSQRYDDDDQMSSTISTTSDSSHHQMMHDDDNSNGPSIPEPQKKKVRQVLKVSPMLSANPRSVLLPVNTVHGVRTFKIVTPAGGIKTIKPFNNQVVLKSVRASTIPVHNVRTSRGYGIKKSKPRPPPSLVDSDEEIQVVSDSDEETKIERNAQYPRLVLSPEERKLMQKEGVTLPTHYPLSKLEERELKRIRRKIRNKISAQDSRKRKKEYLDGLEDRVRQCTQDNLSLVRKIKSLQTQNQTLIAQLKKLQTALAGKSGKPAQPATCLLVIILSMALVMAPNMRLTQNNQDVEMAEQELALTEKAIPPIVAGRTRSLLSSAQISEPEDWKALDREDITMELHDLLHFHDSSDSSESSLSRKSSISWTDAPHFLADHDYDPPPSKRLKHFNQEYDEKDFIVPLVDDVWPPPNINKPKEFIMPDVDDEWLPKGSRLVDKMVDGLTTEVKVNISDGIGTRTVLIQVPKENK